MPSIVSQSQQI